jgi:HEAT repeat protein
MFSLRFFARRFWLCCLLLVISGSVFAQTQSDEPIDARADTAELGRRLADPDPLKRQRAAEALAHLAATDQRKLLEGYYLQEKNKTVRLALEWALYRIGKEGSLFRIVRELDSSRHDQAVGYLTQLDSPELLYPFLQRVDNRPKVTVGVIEVLARSGNADTRSKLEPFRDSVAPGVAAAAEKAIDEIDARGSQSGPAKPTRPRVVNNSP